MRQDRQRAVQAAAWAARALRRVLQRQPRGKSGGLGSVGSRRKAIQHTRPKANPKFISHAVLRTVGAKYL